MTKPLIKIGSQQIGFKIGSRSPAVHTEPLSLVQKPKGRRDERRIRSTSFSLGDGFERSLNEWVEGYDYSRYVKRLIWADMQAGGPVLHGSSSLPEAQCHDVMTSDVGARKRGVLS